MLELIKVSLYTNDYHNNKKTQFGKTNMTCWQLQWKSIGQAYNILLRWPVTCNIPLTYFFNKFSLMHMQINNTYV